MLNQETILKNLRENSDERKECQIVQSDNDPESHDFLGKKYKLVLVGEE